MKKPGDVPGFSVFVVCCILTSSDHWSKNLNFDFCFNNILSRISGRAMQRIGGDFHRGVSRLVVRHARNDPPSRSGFLRAVWPSVWIVH
jgi:hypothetical protein